jgi:hypothetical protein
MEQNTEELLESNREKFKVAGDYLRASHDDAVIADVIGHVEELDSDSASETAEILRFMVESDN